MNPKTDPRIDTYIAEAAEFAQPILKKIRKLVHEACPEAHEAIKWGHPACLLDGKILTIFAAFKAHCGLVFWHHEMKAVLKADGRFVRDAMGHMGRFEKLSDLPDDATLRRYFRQAATLTASGKPARPPAKKKPRPELPVPADLAAALKKNAKAAAAFEKFAPSHRREYIEWITEAKRQETRQKRLATALEWLAEGKQRNWQYAAC